MIVEAASDECRWIVLPIVGLVFEEMSLVVPERVTMNFGRDL